MALEWASADPTRPLWVEHEGRHVGSCLVPPRMYRELRAPPLLLLLQVPRAARVRHLVRMYTAGEAEARRGGVLGELTAAVESLRKRRGGAATAAALEQLRRGDYASVADAALEYYDALYDEYAKITVHMASRRGGPMTVTLFSVGTFRAGTRPRAAAPWCASSSAPRRARRWTRRGCARLRAAHWGGHDT